MLRWSNELLPDAPAVERCLETLLGRSVKARAEGKGRELDGVAYLGVCRDDEGTFAGGIGCDLPGGARLGGALSWMVPAQVERAIAGGALDETLMENLHEVFNVLSSLLNRDGLPHLRLTEIVHRESGELARLRDAPAQQWFSLSIEGYGAGRLLLCRPPREGVEGGA